MARWLLNTSPMIVAKLRPLLILCSLLGACVDDPDEETLAELPTETTTEAITSPPVRLFHALAGATRGTFVSSHSESTRTIHIAYAIARAQGPEKGAIVVSNGRTETFEQYAEIVEDLTLRGYTLYLFDHRGQGRSDRVLPFATVGDGQYQKGSVDDFDDYVDERLLDPLGITSIDFLTDRSGHWYGGLGADMTTRDFARFGLLYLNDGIWDGERVLPEGWVDYSHEPSPTNPSYGAQWWMFRDGAFEARGLFGQIVLVSQDHDLVIAINTTQGGDADTLVSAAYEALSS